MGKINTVVTAVVEGARALPGPWKSARKEAASPRPVASEKQVPAAGSRTHAPALDERAVEDLAARAAARIPSAQSVSAGLRKAGVTDPATLLQLGIALGLPARALLSLSPERDSQMLVRDLLEAACPFDVEKLASCLEMDHFGARELATQVRLLNQDSPRITAEDTAQLGNLASMLAPVTGQIRTLASLLDVDENRINNCVEQFGQRYQEEMLDRLARKACHRKETSCQQWLDALASAGSSTTEMQELARFWLVSAPTPHTSDWITHMQLCRDPFPVAAELMEQERQRPGAPLPLEKVWPLVRPYLDNPALPAALGDTADRGPILPAGNRARFNGLLSLLHRAQEPQDPAGKSLNRTCLQELARNGCMAPDIADQWLALEPLTNTDAAAPDAP